MSDFKVIHHGSLVQIIPQSEQAKDWLEASVDIPDHLRYGSGFCAETRYAEDLLSGISLAGLTIQS